MSSSEICYAMIRATKKKSEVDFSDPPSDFFSLQKATSDKSSDFLDKLKRVSVIVGTAAMLWDQRARSSFSASALFSERLRGAACSVKGDIIVILCVLFDFIRQRLNKIKN